MRKIAAASVLVLAGCGKLVSTSPADFPKGYATLYTTYSESRTGKACDAGSITYYKRNKVSREHWVISEGRPYYASPGTYRVAMWCQSGVDPESGECRNEIYLDWGGPESKVTLEAKHSYAIYCAGTGVEVEEKALFDRSHGNGA